jgi:hypothetical protein
MNGSRRREPPKLGKMLRTFAVDREGEWGAE